MVVLFHARTYVSARGPDDFLTWITNPFSTGIDLFFVISGFVMVYTTQTERSRRPLDFFVKRLCRIVPAYVIATIIYVVCMRIMEHFTGYRGMYDHLTPRDVLKSIAFIPVNLTDPHEPPFFGGSSLHVGWTLNYEAYFYLVFFGSLFFKRFRWLAFGGWMLFILVALPLIFRGAVSLDIRHFYGWRAAIPEPPMTSCLIWEFIMGGDYRPPVSTRSHVPQRQIRVAYDLLSRHTRCLGLLERRGAQVRAAGLWRFLFRDDLRPARGK